MAFQNAKGSAAPTGMPRQPKPAAPDEVSSIRNPTLAGHGQNGDTNGSVAPVGKVISPLAANMRASVDDPTMDTILSRPRGALNEGTDDQTRKISPNADVHPSYGMKLRAPDTGSPGGTVPGKLGANEGQPVRKP